MGRKRTCPDADEIRVPVVPVVPVVSLVPVAKVATGSGPNWGTLGGGHGGWS